MGKKFVGLGGLKHFWTKAKTWIAGQITAEVTAKIAEIVANAPEDLDTLKEIADWIKTHANDASAMNTQINTNKNDIAALQTSVAGKAAASHTHDDRYYTESEIDTKLSGKSDTGHTHTKSEITDFPTSLPANGGNATTASSADKAVSVVDYGDTSSTIKIGYNGAGLTANELLYIAGYKNDGTGVKIKDVRKSVLQSWLGLSNYLPLSGGTMTGTLDVKTAGIRIPTSQPSSLEDGDIWIQ